MALFKSLQFDGIDSLGYGIYITGEAVYNAPERAVELVNIPGRNGALSIDQGRFENIEVTYPCGCFADTQTEFAEKVAAFRNALASRYSYVRLTDGYNTDEYRMALYKSGLEVDPLTHGRAGEFEIKFECKPQRFLLSGEAPQVIGVADSADTEASGSVVTIDSDGGDAVKSVTVSSGASVTVNGRNFMTINAATSTSTGMNITTTAEPSVSYYGKRNSTATFIVLKDNVTLPAGTYILTGTKPGDGCRFQVLNVTKNTWHLDTGGGVTFTVDSGDVLRYRLIVRDYAEVATPVVRYPMIRLASDTDASYEPYNGTTYTSPVTASDIKLNAGINNVWASTGTITLTYGDDVNTIVNPTHYASKPLITVTGKGTLTIGGYTLTIAGTSSQVLYIDCDTMEIYKLSGSTKTSANSLVTITGYDFPQLEAGPNTFTLGTGITNVVVEPRWWRV